MALRSRSVKEVRNCVKASASAGYRNSLRLGEERGSGVRNRSARMETKFLCLQRQCQFNEQAAARCVNGSCCTSMHANNSLRDRQSKTGSLGRRPIGRGNSIEWQENLRQVGVWHTRAIVTHLDHGICGRKRSLPPHDYFDLRMRLCVSDRVANNILNSSADLIKRAYCDT